MKLAERLSKLGTETAFAVSGEAATHVAAGNKVYPFHLGDMNITTPVNITNIIIATTISSSVMPAASGWDCRW